MKLGIIFGTLDELEQSDQGRGKLLQVTLLGQELVIAKLDSGVVAMANRCPHRSAKLHLGWNCGSSVQCAYHGWKYGSDGMCIEIPALPDGPIPPNAKATVFDCEVKYDLIWVRLDNTVNTEIPAHLAFDDPSFTCTMGIPYTWKTHAARRLENYTDLAHFPFVHPETLGNPDFVTFLIPDIDLQPPGCMRFKYEPPEGGRNGMDAAGNLAPLIYTDYTVQLPFGVTLDQPLSNGTRTIMWMWATPIDERHCRTFWFCCNDTKDPFDPMVPIATQMAILEEDIGPVESQEPEQIPHPKDEIATAADKVSLTYRRMLFELCKAKAAGPAALETLLASERNNI
ncbi:hypothetical protein CS022_14095 [Veronia nyctiphanis]|uniref:Rieske domain-containing protein n=1 Tax=Veronia nyctiphanis TaxID=1278244 RepID=A0A4Q0YP93_9GAMM|nr:Rieske 2Fe-2S domain-containing protein [Veronia nyctiphanis]RXJ72762.1 hypothetical protein CS022_14095 [Veronia nyctiphanis]